MKTIKAGDTVTLGGTAMKVLGMGLRHGVAGICLEAPNGDEIFIWENSKLWSELRVEL